MISELVDMLRSKYLSKKIVFVVDYFLSLLSSFSVLLAVNVFTESKMFSGRFFLVYMVLSAVISAIAILSSGCYRIVIRHIGVKDFFPFFVAAGVKSAFILVLMIAFDRYSPILLSLVITDYVFTIFLMMGVRLVMIIVYEYINKAMQEKDKRLQVLVYGVSNKSVATLLRFQNSPHYHIIGFLLKKPQQPKLLLANLPVFTYDDSEHLAAVIREYAIDAILFTTESDARRERDGLLKECVSNSVRPLIIPAINEISGGDLRYSVRNLKIEDLLGRNEIIISMEAVMENFRDKVVLVTGAAGSIGSELCRQIAGFGVRKLVLFDNAETPMHNIRLELEEKFPELSFVPIIGDVRQPMRLDFAFREHHPQVVFHAAAYKHVPLMEENPCEAMLVNVFGTHNVADKCIEYDVEKMVMISTDKAVNPTNVMGATKRIAEIYTQSRQGNTKFITTRFGNVLGSNGSVVPLFRKQIAQGGPITVTDRRITRYFMTIPEACSLVLEAGSIGDGGDIFVFDMGEKVKIWDLAEKMRQLAHRPDVEIIETGLRPGEKLYEEVLANEENTIKTDNEKIMHAVVRKYEASDVDSMLAKLHEELDTCDPMRIVAQMKVIVPEFKSNNSIFSQLDK